MLATSLPSVDCLCLEMRKKINAQRATSILRHFFLFTENKCTEFLFFRERYDLTMLSVPRHKWNWISSCDLWSSFRVSRILVLWCVHGVGKWTWEKRKIRKKRQKQQKICEWMQWLPTLCIQFLRHCCWYYLVFIMIVSILY